METRLNTTHTDRGIDCTLPSGEVVTVITYHGAGLYEVWPAAATEIRGEFRLCDGLEAAEFYSLCLASELRRYRGEK